MHVRLKLIDNKIHQVEDFYRCPLIHAATATTGEVALFLSNRATETGEEGDIRTGVYTWQNPTSYT